MTESGAYGARMEWGVRFADGEVEEESDRDSAIESIKHAQQMVKRAGTDAHAYVGARLVGRRVSVTDWFTLSERCPGHALTYCEVCEWTETDSSASTDYGTTGRGA